MKTFLVAAAVLAVAFMAVLDGSRETTVPLGYYLVAAAGLIAAALWRSDENEQEYFRAVQEVYSALASGPMEAEALVTKLCGDRYPNSDWDALYRQAIGRMLSEGLVTTVDGKLQVPGDA